MEIQTNAGRDWFTVFRTDQNDEWLRDELAAGRLRQGWGASGLGLTTAVGDPLAKSAWETAYRGWGHRDAPSPRRFAILRRMLELVCGGIVVVPKMPARDRFMIARVTGRYRFELADGRKDFGHVIPVDPESVRTFVYTASNEAHLVSGLFGRANHRPAVSFCSSAPHVRAARDLLGQPSSLVSRPRRELWEAAIDDAFRSAAESLVEDVAAWNGQMFEEAVRQSFVDQGYELRKRGRYDREGGDVDMVVSPPPSRHGVFLPTEIAVQVKWKQGVDEDDAQAVAQVVQWAQWQESSATKCVISSAAGFSAKAQEAADAHGVVLVCGLQTMCLLLGVPDRYREEWDEERR